MATKKSAGERDPLLGSTDVGSQIGTTPEYARRLMLAGAFGQLFDVGSGEHRARPRVRQSGVDRWIETRAVKRVSA